MTKNKGNRPAEIFGYPLDNNSPQAQDARKKHWCPFTDTRCAKKSRLLDYPFGVCSVEIHGEICTICPRRFEERGTFEGVSKVLQDVAQHYFGDLNNTIVFPEIRLPNIGSIDYVLVKHKPMKAQITDFVAVEFQADSTTGTGGVVQGIVDFFQTHSAYASSYKFGMNTYDTIKRSMTQLLNKGIVYERWNTKCYWVIQEYIYSNLIHRYGFKTEGFQPEHASRFALYNLVRTDDHFTLTSNRLISTTVDQVYQAMRHNPGLPNKDDFVQTLTARLQARLSIEFQP